MAAVQAWTPAPAAYPSPATSLSTPMTAASWGAGALHQRLNAFVKRSLIQQLVPNGAVVCDLYCGRGVDTKNWAEAEIGKYIGVDLSSSALEEAKEQWEKNGKPFVARFCELNPCMVDLENYLDEDRLSADIVTCLAHLQDCFASEDMVRQLLKNVASLLKPGGYFFGATPDSSTIWYKYQKAVEGAMKAGSLRANGQLPRVKTDLYSISFEDDRFNQYGSRYQLRFTDDTVPPQPQILVHFPGLIRLAEEIGLEYVEIQNLTEFYEDYRVPFAETLQNSCGTLVDGKGNPVVDGKSRLSPIAQDVLSLYTTFIFKKPDPEQKLIAIKRAASFVPAPAPTPPLADVKKHKKSSPAVPIRIPASEELPSKKRKLSASPAVASSNGLKLQESKTPSSASKPKPETVAKNEPGRSFATPEASGVERTQKTESPSTSKPKASGGQLSESPSTVKPKDPAGQRSESPSASKARVTGAQRTESPSVSKPKAVEEGQRTESPNLGTQEAKVEGTPSSKSNAHGSSEPDVDRPSSSGLRSVSKQRIGVSEQEKRPGNNDESGQILQGIESDQIQGVPVKRKRVSRWSSEYVPKKTILAAEQLPRVDTVPNLSSTVRELQVNNGGPRFRGFPGPVEGAANVSDGKPHHDTRYNHKESNTIREPSRHLRGSYQKRSPLPKPEHRNGSKERTPNHEDNSAQRIAEPESQVKEEGEIVPEPPVHKTSTPKRERPVGTELHYERRTAQKTQPTETATRNSGSIGPETLLEGGTAQKNKDSQAGPATRENPPVSEPRSQRGDDSTADARPEEGSIQEAKSSLSEAAVTALDPVKHEFVEPAILVQESKPEDEGLSGKSQRKDVAIDVLMARTSNQGQVDAATCATAVVATELPSEKGSKESAASAESQTSGQKKDYAAPGDFENVSKLSRDIPAAAAAVEHQSKGGYSTQKRESVLEPSFSAVDMGRNHPRESSSTEGSSRGQGSKRAFEPVWETKPQRYTMRRAASEMSDVALESPQVWCNRGAFPGQKVNNRDQQGRGPMFHPRIPYVNPVSAFAGAHRPPLRAAERGRIVPVVAPVQVGAGLPGLLGAAPSPVFGDRGIVPGDRRFEAMGPPEGSRGYSHSPNDHRGPRSMRGSLYNERAAVGPRGPSGDGAYSSASNGLGAPWDDPFQGDGRSRNR